MKQKLLWSLAIGLPLIGVIVIGWHAWNVRSERLWEAKKKELGAKGVSVDSEFVLARRVPQELNASEAPITSAVLNSNSSTFSDPSVVILRQLGQAEISAKFDPRTGEAATFKLRKPPFDFPRVGTDEQKLVEWSRKFDAPIAVWIDELGKYPKSQFIVAAAPKSLLERERPKFTHGLGMVKNLHAMALANLQAGNVEVGYRETLLMLELSRINSDQRDPLTERISHSALWMAVSPIYLGIKNGSWSDAQLQAFDAELDKNEIMKRAITALCGDLCTYCDTVDKLESRHFKFSMFYDDGYGSTGPEGIAGDQLQGMAPSAVFNDARRNGADFYMEHFISVFDLGKQQIDLAKLDESKIRAELDRAGASPHATLLKWSAGLLGTFAFGAFSADLDIKLTRIAIAVERYKLKYQNYPADLITLVPEFLSAVPVDWAYQKAPSYEQTPSGRYRIWHPGWDGRDEGGVPTRKLERTRGDLIWTFDPIKLRP